MIENQKDTVLTKALRKCKVFQSPKSWISFAGHVYLRNQDRSALRDKLFSNQKHCMICGKPGRWNDEMDHEVGARKLDRCDCYNTLLVDGELHTNVQRVHHSCHVKKHGRYPRWTQGKT